MNTHDIELPPNPMTPMLAALIDKASGAGTAETIWQLMQDYTHQAIALDRQQRGEPDYFTYVINGHHRGISETMPPDDSYDEGTLSPLYIAPQPANPVVKESLTTAEPEDDKLNLDRLADYIADNWPDKKYSLEEVCQRLHATWPTAFMPAEPVKAAQVSVPDWNGEGFGNMLWPHSATPPAAYQAQQDADNLHSLQVAESFNADIPVTDQEEEEWNRLEDRK